MEGTKKVAVIGAGTSGLMAIKNLKEENFEPVCFEKTSRVGGLWHYHEDDIDGIPSCMWCTSLNNSKELGAISDFPPKSDYPNYMRHFKVLEMFMDYAKTFDLLHHIRYNKEVIHIMKTQDYNEIGEWKVVVKDNITGHHSEDVYSGVLVCTGHLSIPNVPHFPGMKSFKRKIIHSHSIKKFLEFNDKTVCVIGTGSSALDSAVEISHVAKQVYMSVRTPTWIMTRHGPYGYPLDWSILKWSFAILQNYFPRSICNKVIQEVFIDPRFSHDLYNILPKHGPLDRDFALSDALPSRLMSGAILLKKAINYFTEDGIVFCEEGNTVTSVDIVVLATGYLWEFPFLDSEDLIIQDKIVHLYKCVYPPHLKHPTLGIIGFIVPMGPGFPCVEMQCRWFAHVMSGKSKLPSQKEMLNDIYRQIQG
ncbi:flavin-containing monooxygenase 5-like [Stegodyphus dumicola]|uniref:flavin-containing monooxygenase 5-like n=1 Tax=Stegodyphus dumicola TaxID=202533 RepID=UPI0015AE464E|nr:flavin-containing monooxygenase 5-like [Stegodyphus dumicola]